jgi:hypothetical protein
LLAIQYSFRGAGEPRPLGGDSNITMNVRFTYIPLVILAVFALGALSGCVSNQTIRPELLPSYVGNEIVVTTVGGRQIRYRESDYTLDTSGAVVVLHGNGGEFTDDSHAYTKPFCDSIRVSEMNSVEVRQRTIFYYSGPIIFVTAILLVALLALMMAASGSHGVGG